MIQARATARFVRTSAQKAGLVMDLIRGRNVNDAIATLRFARKRIAKDIEKVLRSAIANASQKEGFGGDVERLFVSECYANQGPSMKRIRPAPMGRAFRVVKRSAHLTVKVTERPETIGTPKRARAPKPQGGRGTRQAGTTTKDAGAAKPRARRKPAQAAASE